MVPNFLSAAWHGEASHGVGVQYVKSLILFHVLFLLDGGSRREEKRTKINCSRGEGFPWGWTCLAGCVMGCSC
jgi:hypothetical protein